MGCIHPSFYSWLCCKYFFHRGYRSKANSKKKDYASAQGQSAKSPCKTEGTSSSKSLRQSFESWRLGPTQITTLYTAIGDLKGQF